MRHSLSGWAKGECLTLCPDCCCQSLLLSETCSPMVIITIRTSVLHTSQCNNKMLWFQSNSFYSSLAQFLAIVYHGSQWLLMVLKGYHGSIWEPLITTENHWKPPRSAETTEKHWDPMLQVSSLSQRLVHSLAFKPVLVVHCKVCVWGDTPHWMGASLKKNVQGDTSHLGKMSSGIFYMGDLKLRLYHTILVCKGCPVISYAWGSSHMHK